MRPACWLTEEVEVTVLEAGNRWGGKLVPVAINGVRLDGGAESILARRPEGLQLINDLALNARVVHPSESRPQLLVGGQLHQMPASLLGVPTDVGQLAGLLSAEGWRTAASEPEWPAPAFDHDVAIGRYVEERFGAEVTDRLLEPLLGGVYAGYARRLSFDAVAHELFRMPRPVAPCSGTPKQWPSKERTVRCSPDCVVAFRSWSTRSSMILSGAGLFCGPGCGGSGA